MGEIRYSTPTGSAGLLSLMRQPNHLSGTVNPVTPRVLVDVFSVPKNLRQSMGNLRR